MSGTHREHQDCPWSVAVIDHPPRNQTAAVGRSCRLMMRLVGTIPDWVLAGDARGDHHGGAVWVQDATGRLCRQLPLGIEWSAQFCADPRKVDHLRHHAVRVAAACPATLPAVAALGHQAAAHLLATPITTAAHVATRTDSIVNASLPLPSATGALPAGPGDHHYQKPIVDIDHVRFDDSPLFVTDAEGVPTVVVPVARRGGDDGRVPLIAAHPDSRYIRKLIEVDVVRPAGDVDGTLASGGTRRTRPALLTADDADVLPDTDPLAQKAFARQPAIHQRSRAPRRDNQTIGPKRSSS